MRRILFPNYSVNRLDPRFLSRRPKGFRIVSKFMNWLKASFLLLVGTGGQGNFRWFLSYCRLALTTFDT